MINLDLYNRVRSVPAEAQKTIKAGRTKGFTDINPMWRIKTLTEQFGYCGIGWYTEITKQWLETADNGEVAAFVNINLYIKVEGEWSKPIQGTGGSRFVANETNGKYVSDECFKMAYTDAISVATKALGFGADIYWNSDKTKYDTKAKEEVLCPECGKLVKATKYRGEMLQPEEVIARFKMCAPCYKERKAALYEQEQSASENN